MKLTFELDHIGVAVESLEKGKPFWETLGLGPMTTERVDSEKVLTGFFELGNDARIELLEPTHPDSPIAKYLSKRGPGIHHICLKVNDIRAVMKALKAQGVQLINEEPKLGAHDCEVAFIHPKSTGGILLELSQPRGAK
ncbi:MAG: methylmalonyl-CoA epimerase [Bdellovibrionales bacterium]|nr:methylmalonyl-CoA epimerase [Bdellovibrionales bacterium]